MKVVVVVVYRAENGPCGYLVIAVNRSQSKFIWILNSNLKVRKQ